ncbi:SDR family oxidoreductase [Mycobacterium sp. HUMS_1102779]|uniref:SDR family oxidoreductase n=1 Tax=Mycobacterium sp. HUMS_1102779 TaxID=3383487 RepID=UPI00389A4D75
MTTIAVIGATGTAGSRVAARLRSRGVGVVEVSRAGGCDVVSGHGLAEALEGVDTVIDVCNPAPGDYRCDPAATITTATRNLVGACASHGVERLVLSTIAGMENPEFDGLPYFEAKRAAEEIVLEGPIPPTIVKSTQWHESAVYSDAVVCRDGEVVAQDWLIQPIAADTVADVLVEAALGQTRTPRTITGPEVIRLPDLASKLLAARGDGRRVRVVKPALAPLAVGGLLAPDHAVVLGPDVDTWLEEQVTPGAAAEQTPNC